jgi:small subunit ribosomal protein S4
MADETTTQTENTSTSADAGVKSAGLRFVNAGGACRKCRRVGMKLFLKGDRCASPKCALTRRSYAPGQHGQKRTRLSDYGRHLQEKQKLAYIYGLNERQLRTLVGHAAKFKENTEEKIVQLLETRLDSVVYDLGWARSREEARKLVVAGHFLINNKKVTRVGFNVQEKDEIMISDRAIKLKLYRETILPLARDKQVPVWFNKKEETKAKVARLPQLAEVNLFNILLPLVIEFYSR